MKRITWIRIFFTAVLLFALAACGGSSNGESQPTVDQTPVVPLPDPTVNTSGDTMSTAFVETLQYDTIDSVMITVNGIPLESLLSGQ